MTPLVEFYPFLVAAFLAGRFYHDVNRIKRDVEKHDLRLAKIERCYVSRLIRLEQKSGI